jgi:hypothetical protein
VQATIAKATRTTRKAPDNAGFVADGWNVILNPYSFPKGLKYASPFNDLQRSDMNLAIC